MWPDTDGDTARRSFDTTLYRLRRIIEDERLLSLTDGKLSLDNRYCWVDVWALGRMLGQLQRIRMRDTDGDESGKLETLLERVLRLYQGHFLASDDATSWSISLRERLRSKFIHVLLEAGLYWENNDGHEIAMRCYRKGLEVDDLVEQFYQRQMRCCLKLQRIPEGISADQRCRQTLSLVLGLQPDAETMSLYRSLKEAGTRQQASA